MSKRIRLIRTMIIEYEPDPEWYPAGSTIEEMAALDATSDDQNGLFEGETVEDETRYEIIDDEDSKAGDKRW